MSALDTTRRRVTGLLALSVFLIMAIAGTIISYQTLKAGADQIARLIALATIAVDQRLAEGHGLTPGMVAGGVRVGTQPPSSTGLASPMMIEIAASLNALVGSPKRVSVVEVDGAIVAWVRSINAPDRWIGFTVEPVRVGVLRSSLLVLSISGLMVILFATLIARDLTRPLEHLARAAPHLMSGRAAELTDARAPFEVKELARALGDAASTQREVTRERELLLAGISHDLRTPLARLRLALELGDAADPQRREAMVRDLDELDAIIDGFLAYVRDGRDEALLDADPGALLGQLLALRARPEDWSLSLPAAPLVLRFKPLMLKRALTNLLDNAERYGAAPFALTLVHDLAARVARIEVRDNGPGVPADRLEKLGKPFVRGDAARGGRGSGLGLAIASRAAREHGGHLLLVNGEGGGFIATITLALT